MKTISTKEIRNDLKGFLTSLKNGQTIRVIHRSKPLVTLVAKADEDAYEAPDAGTHAAAKRSIALAKKLSERSTTLDPHKSFKQLYEETRTL